MCCAAPVTRLTENYFRPKPRAISRGAFCFGCANRVRKFRRWHNLCAKNFCAQIFRFSKPLILLGFFAIRAVGIVKAEWQVLEPKQLTKQQTKEK
jgi:hypothetical protein